MDDMIYKIFMLLISLLGVVLTGLIVPWLKIKVGKEKLGDVEKWIAVAVSAAEQMYAAGLLTVDEDRKDYVLRFIRDKGITITDEELNALIEAAVYELNKAKYLLFRDLDYFEDDELLE